MTQATALQAGGLGLKMEFSLSNFIQVAIQAALLMASVGVTIVTLRVTVKFLKAEFEEMKISNAKDISGIQTELKKIGDILVNQADMRGDIKLLSQRIDGNDVAIQNIQTRCEREHFAARAL